MNKSSDLIGKRISITRHHDAFPSDITGGVITNVGNGEVTFTTTDGKTESRNACKGILDSLVENGKYESDHMWSRSSEFYYILK